MFCRKCGKEIEENQSNCHHCGEAQSSAPSLGNENLVSCKHCNKKISKIASSCVHCGASTVVKTNQLVALIIIAFLIFAVVTAWPMISRSLR